MAVAERGAITGLILAGGRGSRMGGLDKGWIELRGRALIRHVLERFSSQVGSVVISANRNLSRYRELGVEVVADDTSRFGEFAGPLAGVLQALRGACTPWLAVVPCDAPMLPLDLVVRLADAVGHAEAATAQLGERIEPLFCLLRTRLAVRLEDALESGVRRPTDFLLSVGAVAVQFESNGAFANLNTQSDLLAG
jgi:molybdenum cofactor guanylyltransferase